MWQKVWTNRCPLKLRMASVSLEWVGAKSQPENGFRTIDWPTPYSVLPKAALRCCSGGTFVMAVGHSGCCFCHQWRTAQRGLGANKGHQHKRTHWALTRHCKAAPERTLRRPVPSTAATNTVLTLRTRTTALTKRCSSCSCCQTPTRENWEYRCCCSCNNTQLAGWVWP